MGFATDPMTKDSPNSAGETSQWGMDTFDDTELFNLWEIEIWLVVSIMNFMFHNIYGIICPID